MAVADALLDDDPPDDEPPLLDEDAPELLVELPLLLDAPLPPDEPLLLEGEEDVAPLPLYPSAYHPPPLSMNELREISRCTLGSPHLGQSVTGGSEIFCHSSNVCPQAKHSYS